MKRRSAASLFIVPIHSIDHWITFHMKCIMSKSYGGRYPNVIRFIEAYPDASCNLQMPLTDFCLRATIATGSSDWLLGPTLSRQAMGWLRFLGKVQL